MATAGVGAGRSPQSRTALDELSRPADRRIQPSDRIEDAVDDILDRLVNHYDAEELPRRRELANLEAIIEHDGDLRAATRPGNEPRLRWTRPWTI